MKKHSLAFYTFVFGLTFLLTFNTFAQVASFTEVKKEEIKTCASSFKMPSSISTNTEAFINYIKVMSLPSGARQQAFSALSNEDKATLFKVKMALEFIKRPSLNKEQKGLLLDTIATTTADIYDKTNSAKVAQAERYAKILENNAFRLFPKNEAFEIFADMNGNYSNEIELLKNYEYVLSLPTMSFRKRKVRRLSPLEKSLYWKTQMVYYLSTARLNNIQQSFIVKTIPFLTPRAFDLPNKDNLRVKNNETELLNSLEIEASKLFTIEEAFVFFMSSDIRKNRNPMLIGEIQAFDIGIEEGGDGSPPSCECKYMCGALCVGCNGTNCSATQTGCGWYENQPCTKACTAIPNCP